VDDLFAPPGAEWQRVSPRLSVVRRSLLAGGGAVGCLVVLVLAVVTDVPAPVVVALLVALALAFGWSWWLVGRGVRRWGYAEQDEELYITRGALFRRLVVVPYGRMQYVDVNAGPLDQLNGIATVQLHTASPGTTAVIPGLPSAEAARLRDRLTAMGETRAAGL
jgi:membrane protein YdbS with pleckstrin-like domain